jgi:ketosteroid isomerase-like protein
VHDYFTSLLRRDGKVIAHIAANCIRTENGVTMTGKDKDGSCEDHLSLGLFKPVEAVRARHIDVADAERGLIVVSGYYDKPALTPSFTDSKGRQRDMDARYPHSLGFMSLFHIRDGKIARIDEITNEVIYRMPASGRR